VESDAKENCVSLIIRTGMLLKIDHTAVVTAVSFLHRFYAENSVFKNDRFAISMACLYLGGKVADSPKSSRDVLMAGFSVLYPKERPTKEWLDAARKKLVRAERVVLYQTGFKFASKTANQHMLDLLREKQLNSFLTSTLKGDAVKFFNLSNALVRALLLGRMSNVECRMLRGALSRDGGRPDDGGRSQTPLSLVPLSHSFSLPGQFERQDPPGRGVSPKDNRSGVRLVCNEAVQASGRGPESAAALVRTVRHRGRSEGHQRAAQQHAQ
jgi:hypothetical protein